MLLRRLLLPGLCALALAAPATAQDPQVDPGSPAGTEYQLPIDRAREEAGGRSGGSSGSGGSTSSEAPLFGAGVESEKPTSGNRKSGTESDPATTADVEPDTQTSTPETARAQASAPDDGAGALVAIGAGAGGVLLLGGLAGLALRRRTVRR
ncbi:MAG: hypothetical protein M3401_14785 [Actinomycetota bacterium]|nr:hypothetical protein [Actinomycetota bacterium]